MKKTVLFICTHNSTRSQIAEGLLNALFGDRYKAYSAGMEPAQVNPYAMKVRAQEDILRKVRHVRDEIKSWIEETFGKEETRAQ